MKCALQMNLLCNYRVVLALVKCIQGKDVIEYQLLRYSINFLTRKIAKLICEFQKVDKSVVIFCELNLQWSQELCYNMTLIQYFTIKTNEQKQNLCVSLSSKEANGFVRGWTDCEWVKMASGAMPSYQGLG